MNHDIFYDPGSHSAAAQEPRAERRRHDAGKHPLLIWTGLDFGDVVSWRTLGNRHHIGTVEQRTNDGLMIWIRDEINERKLLHFRDCQFVALIAPDNADNGPSVK